MTTRVAAAACLVGCCLAMLSGKGQLSLAQPPTQVAFVDEAAEAGVVLMNVSGTREKRYIVDTTGAGACFLDYDLDGDVDLYIVNGASLETVGPSNPARNALYRNDGAGRFSEVGEQAGVADNGWGGGCSVADYDNDGDPDLYVTNYGPNVLYRNEGNGTFSDVTAAAGVGDPRWSLGAAFVDIDRDGDLDLYVANYLRFTPDDPTARSSECRWKGVPVMCGPRGFQGEADTLYRNNGDGTFTDVSADAGVARKALFGMGVVSGDVDQDGDADIFVANDSQDNHLFLNDGSGRFEDRALLAGVALSGDGRQQAGMGTDLGDYDNDGDEDLFITNFSDDYHTLYRNDGRGLFTDVTAAAGLDPATRSSLGWGTGFFDYDNDGDLDLFVASGHVYPQVDGHDPATSYRQQNLLFRNERSGRFTNVSDQSGPGLLQRRTGRGVAFGDYDDDGDLDVAVVNENDVPTLLRNDGGGGANRHWLKVRLVGRKSNRDGIGARLYLRTLGRVQFREVRLNSGYCSSHDSRIHFGLDQATKAESLEIRWPSGGTQVFDDLPAGHVITIDEERGITGVGALGRPNRTARPRDLRPGSAPQSASKTPAAVPSRFSTGAARRLSASDLRELDGLVQTGTMLIVSGQYAEGITNYERALARLPPWEAAASTSDALGFGDPERYRIFLGTLYDNLGVGLMRADRLDECAVAIGQGIALLPGRAKFHHNLGLCHFHARRYSEAVIALQAAREAGASHANLSYDLGRTLALAGRCKEAVDQLRPALEQPLEYDPQGRRAERWYYLGSCHADEGRQEEAAHAFREALALVPGHQKALYKLGLARKRAGQAASAERIQVLFQARQPADERVRSMRLAGIRTPFERLALAQLFLDAGLPHHAVTELEMILASGPTDAAALVLLGESYLALHPPVIDRAQNVFGRALLVNASQVNALAGLGETYRLGARLDASERMFKKALAIQPGHIAATVGLARLFYGSGRVEDAVKVLEEIVRQNPNEPRALRALAEVHATAAAGPYGRPDEALRLLAKAGDLYGEGVETRIRALVRLGELREAERLLEDSPFLGQTERNALGQLIARERPEGHPARR